MNWLGRGFEEDWEEQRKKLGRKLKKKDKHMGNGHKESHTRGPRIRGREDHHKGALLTKKDSMEVSHKLGGGKKT